MAILFLSQTFLKVLILILNTSCAHHARRILLEANKKTLYLLLFLRPPDLMISMMRLKLAYNVIFLLDICSECFGIEKVAGTAGLTGESHYTKDDPLKSSHQRHVSLHQQSSKSLYCRPLTFAWDDSCVEPS